MKRLAWMIAAAILMIALSGCIGNTGNKDDNKNKQNTENTGNAGAAPAGNGQTPDGQSSDPEQPVSSGAGGEDGRSGTTDNESPAKNRPESKSDTIELEGNPEPFEFKLHDNPALQFSTYIVNDLLIEGAGSGQDGDSLLVYANFAGKLNKDALVRIYSPGKGTQTTVEEQTQAAKRNLEDEGGEITQSTAGAPNRFAISDKEIHFSKQNEKGHSLLGTVSVFKHGDRIYIVTVQYPEDWEEGFVPRVNKMFEDIVWYETP